MPMAVLLPILFSSLFLSFPLPSSSRTYTSITKGSLISPQDVLISTPNSIFTAGFFLVGQNSYCFSIWFTEQYDGNYTIVWMANRDQPVNGLHTKLSFLNSGNLALIDGGQLTVWTSNTMSSSASQLQLHDNGNLILNTSEGEILWQSFDFPTTTLLPQQLFTRHTMLVSSRSETNHSSGFYKLYFGSDNVLHLRFEGPDITSVFWPDPMLVIWDAGRLTYNSSKIAMLDSTGHFLSSDMLQFNTTDYGVELQRRMVIDVDGNLRIYSLDKANRRWLVTWQQSSEPCKINGICGANSICSYDREAGRKCTCIPGYKMKNMADWSYGCEPDFKISCNDNISSGFAELLHVEYPGYDLGSYTNYTFESCKRLCLSFCECKGFQYKFDLVNGYYSCFPKTVLLNGYRSEEFQDPMYIRLPAANLTTFQKPGQDFNLQCPGQVIQLGRSYEKKKQDWVKSFLWCTLAVGAFEVTCLLTYFIKTRRGSSARIQGYLQVATGFRKFSYAELKKATKDFSEEIGQGGGGVVYKGILSDNRVAAIKFLKEAVQGEAEFLAEVSTIGRLNHMNLIELWGYCAEGKHRLLVYEYMEHGSLAKNLYSGRLDWWKRHEIALGTARGLAYLHEECLEWVLHCDVKPENILLNSEYQPKVADFGLSKLLNRNGIDDIKFSRIRGTRGYMAPEWAFNLPITSKVDVYGYGIVVLEMITGRRPTGSSSNDDGNGVEPRRLISWVKEKMREANSRASPTPITEIVDPAMNGDFEMEKMEVLVRVALQCAEEDMDSRPTMKQVVDILLQQQ